MKSKRDLKKQIRYICGDLVGECMIIDNICPEEKHDEVARLIIDLALLQETTLSHCNFAFDKSRRDFANGAEYNKARNAYFREAYGKLHDDFNKRLRELIHTMNSIAGLAKGQ